MVEKAFYIRIQHIAGSIPLYHRVQFPERLMTVPSGAKPHHTIVEVRFKDCLQYFLQCLLNQLVFVAIDTQRSHFTVVFRNFDPACRLWFICLSFPSVDQDVQIVIQILAVDFFGNPINTYGFLSIHLYMTFHEQLLVNHVPDRCKDHLWILA